MSATYSNNPGSLDPALTAGQAAGAPGSSPDPVPAPPVPWIPIGWFIALVAVLFAPVLYSMINEWLTDDGMGHGIFVPFLAGYIAYQGRQELLTQPVNPSWFGLLPVVLGFVMMVAGTLGADFFVPRVGLMVTLVGVLWTIGGTWTIRRLLFPLFILLFMIRIPLFIYSQITFPLQILASRFAEHALTLIGIPVLRDGNILELPSQRLNVVEACSGIRSLMSLGLLSLVYGYFFDEKKWMRWVLLAMSVPIAIFANGLRVTLTGVMSEVNKELAEGAFHTAEGLILWLVSLAGLWAAHRLVNWMYALARGRSTA